MNVIRDKKEQTLTLTLPEHKQTGSVEETRTYADEDAEIIDLQAMNIELARIRPQLELAIERSNRRSLKYKWKCVSRRGRYVSRWRRSKRNAQQARRYLRGHDLVVAGSGSQS